MNKTILRALVCLASISLFADTPLCPDGKHWEPIPADVWQMKADPTTNASDAIILEYRAQINCHAHASSYYVIQSRRIYILNESGKAAAYFTPFSQRSSNIIGRTVLPDGKVILFDSIKDFIKKDVITTTSDKVKHTRLIPPGITNNCIVEIQWEEPLFTIDRFGNANGDLQKFNKISSQYAINNIIIDICDPIPVSVMPYNALNCKYSLKSISGHKIFTWNNLPGIEPEPFSIASTIPAPGISLVHLSKYLYAAAKQGPDNFWNACGSEIFKSAWSVRAIKGFGYTTFSKSILQDLPSEPQAMAQELSKRLREYFLNLNNMTYREKVSCPKEDEWPDVFDFENMVNNKKATSMGMFLIYFDLLKETKITKKLLATSSRNGRMFKYSEFNLHQLQDYYLGIDEPGKETLWIAPDQRFCPPGLMLAAYQATPALEYDLQSWKAKLTHIPVQPMETNQLQFDYHLEIEDDADHFTAKNEFLGLPAYYRRNDLVPIAEDEQTRQVKEHWESKLTGLACNKIQVQNLLDITKPLAYRIEGQVERETGKRREVAPFPGMAFPFSIPARFPEKRSTMIVLPYALIHSATSTFKVPKGYELAPSEAIDQSNTLGRVLWKAEAGPDGAAVTLRVELKTVVLSASEYSELQSFLGWVKDAFARTLILKKS